jgi:hypothetical protein
MSATSASAWSVIPTQPQLVLLHTCMSQQECISVKTKVFTAILYPFPPSPPPQFGDFQVGAIVQRDRLKALGVSTGAIISNYYSQV